MEEWLLLLWNQSSSVSKAKKKLLGIVCIKLYFYTLQILTLPKDFLISRSPQSRGDPDKGLPKSIKIESKPK